MPGLLTILSLAGCASFSAENLGLSDADTAGLPRQAQVRGVHNEQQTDDDSCGPSALAMVFAQSGVVVAPALLRRQTLSPNRGGTLTIDMVTASRRHGFTVDPVIGLPAVLTTVAQGTPVIALENLRVSWWPQWHYVVVVGYDLNTATLRLHSGRSTPEQLPISTFLERWHSGNDWAIRLSTAQLPP